jgi:hypothetical protein
MAVAGPIRSIKNVERSTAAVSGPVLLQLERILASSAFCNSKRNKRFLRFIVEQTLQGHADSLKERLIGIDVFDRAPDYDLATDSIVRVAAVEVRKRLAQYYVENAHADEIRIQLRPGSYVPEFNAVPTAEVAQASARADETQTSESPDLRNTLDPSRSHISHRNSVLLWCVLAVAIPPAAAVSLYWAFRPSPIDRFWKPFTDSANPTVFCLGDLNSSLQLRKTARPTGLETGLSRNNYLSLADVEAMNRVSRTFIRKSQAFTTLSSGSTTLTDLRHQPAVLIGGSTNQWTMRAMQFLRYQLVPNETTGIWGIRDQKDDRILWTVDFNVPFPELPKTYAILARFNDPMTGQPTVIVDGVGAAGTIAGAEFLSTPLYFKEFLNRAPEDWAKRNFEIVLEMQMINGNYGPPRVIGTYFW